MIEHLQGRKKALEPFGWTGREAGDCPSDS